MHTGIQMKNVSRLTDARRASRGKNFPLLDINIYILNISLLPYFSSQYLQR